MRALLLVSLDCQHAIALSTVLGTWTLTKLPVTHSTSLSCCGLLGYIIGNFFFFAPESLLNRTQEDRKGCCEVSKGLLLVKTQGQSHRLHSSGLCRLCDVDTAATSKRRSRVTEAGQFLEHQMVIAKQ